MAEILTSNKNYYDIADTIRQMKNVSTTYKPREMAPALKDIYSNEVEGTLPLTFESNGMPLIDYRIDGASGGVGDLVTDSSDDNYGKYKVPVVCGGTTTNIYLDKPIEARANIPNEYEEVEYIESTGTQYINTGIKVNSTTSRYETKIKPSSVSGTRGIFGTRNNTTADSSSMNVFIINGAFRLDWVAGSAYNVNNISTNTEYTISITRGLATINNVDYTSENTTSVNSLYTFYIGNFNNVGRPFSNGFSGKIYYSKLYNNNILVFDGVPCYRKSDNVAGLYDLVNNTFYTNQGTGNFIVGPIKENESISLSDTNTNIPTIDGTNTLTIDTTVQPSNVYIQAPKDHDDVVFLTQVLEEGI